METNRTYCEKYKGHIVNKIKENMGCRTVYKFPNSYGASVIYGKYSHGLELAVLYFDGDQPHISDALFNNDVFGYIKDEAELEKLLDQIKELKK